MSVSEDSKDAERRGTEVSYRRRLSSDDRHPTPEELAPDGGWGWMVFAGMTLTFVVCFSSMSSMGMVYRELLSNVGNDGSALMILNVSYGTSFSIGALFCNEFLKRYSMRSIGVLGGLIYGVSNTLMGLMPSVGYMAVTQFSMGIGASLIGCVYSTSLNAYFVKRRTMVFTASHVVGSAAATAYPFLIEYLLSAYGFRGCLMVLGALSFNSVCGMLTVDPVEMHYKRPKLGPASDPSRSRLISGTEPETSRNLRTPWRGSSPEIFSNGVPPITGSNARVEICCDSERKIAATEANYGAGVGGRIASILADFFEVSLLRDGVFLNICLGLSFAFLADGTFHNFLPLILGNDGYTMVEIALVLTVGGIAEVASKLCLATFSLFFKAKARHLYFGSICTLFLSRIAFMYCRTLSSVIVVMMIINLVRCWYIVTQTLVIAEHVKIERFSAGFGLSVLIMGGIGLILGPAIGFVKDWTKSYAVLQYVLLAVMMLCIAPWAVEMAARNFFAGRGVRRETGGRTESPKG